MVWRCGERVVERAEEAVVGLGVGLVVAEARLALLG